MTFGEALASAEAQYQHHRANHFAALSVDDIKAIQRNDSIPRSTGRRITIERERERVVLMSQCPYVGITRLIKGAR